MPQLRLWSVPLGRAIQANEDATPLTADARPVRAHGSYVNARLVRAPCSIVALLVDAGDIARLSAAAASQGAIGIRSWN